MNEQFGKAYKLCSKKIQNSLFDSGKKLSSFPFTMVYGYHELPTDKKFQVVISVPKRQFKHAHDRNRIKRLLRECIRKNKLILEEVLNNGDKQLALFLIYRHNEELTYEQLLGKTKKILIKLTEQIENP